MHHNHGEDLQQPQKWGAETQKMSFFTGKEKKLLAKS